MRTNSLTKICCILIPLVLQLPCQQIPQLDCLQLVCFNCWKYWEWKYLGGRIRRKISDTEYWWYCSERNIQKKYSFKEHKTSKTIAVKHTVGRKMHRVQNRVFCVQLTVYSVRHIPRTIYVGYSRLFNIIKT